MNTNNSIGLWLSALGVFTLVACGGGGGGGDSVTAPVASSGLTYAGVTSPAAIDSNNAAELAGNAYIGGETGSDLGLFNSVSDTQPDPKREIRLHEVVKILGDPLYKIDFHGQGRDSLAVKSEQAAVAGDCGGTARYTVTMDDVNGTFIGSMTFIGYCNANTTISGTAGFSGHFDVAAGNFLDSTLSFDMVSLESGSQSYVIEGDLSVDVSGPALEASLDMLMQDGTGEIFWVNDYALTITEGVDYVDLEVSGRFYHPTHGYVDLSTTRAVRTKDIHQWPSSGELAIIGGGGTTARLIAIDENYCRITADTNGDGYDDYLPERINWNDL